MFRLLLNCSILQGYLAIQLYGLAVGTSIFSSAKKATKKIDDVIIELFAYSILHWTAYGVLGLTQIRVSRQIVRFPRSKRNA